MEKIKSMRTTSLLKYTIFSTGKSTATKCLGYNSKFMSLEGHPASRLGYSPIAVDLRWRSWKE
jgi:hypothetical protein